MKWRVTGADETTGDERIIDVEADDRGSAEQKARTRHVLVSDVKMIPDYAQPATKPIRSWNPGGQVVLVFAALFYLAGFGGLINLWLESAPRQSSMVAAAAFQSDNALGATANSVEKSRLAQDASSQMTHSLMAIGIAALLHLVHHASRCYAILHCRMTEQAL